MVWARARLRHARNVETQSRVAEVGRARSEYDAWLGLLEAALGESEDGARWEAAVPKPAADRPVKAPLLSRAEITVDGRAARGWVRRLLRRAVPVAARRLDGLALLEAAVCLDDARVDALARTAGAEPQPVRVAGQLAALPLLQTCGRGLAPELPAAWWEGYCPLCGAWPVLAEYTGLERTRQLRCGRSAAAARDGRSRRCAACSAPRPTTRTSVTWRQRKTSGCVGSRGARRARDT